MMVQELRPALELPLLRLASTAELPSVLRAAVAASYVAGAGRQPPGVNEVNAMISMLHVRRSVFRIAAVLPFLGMLLAFSPALFGQTCSTGADLDAANKTAIDAAAQKYLDMSKNGDVAGLKANAIPEILG